MSYKFANVKTELPGPKAKELLERRKQYVPKGVSNGIPTFVEKAQGAILTDVDGNTFIDFAGAIGTINAGHCAPEVVEALHDQVDKYIHTGFNVMMYEPYIELAERLAKLAPGDHEKQVLFLNSGAEAVENAVKIARKYTKRQGVVVFSRGFHGRTLLTMTMTSKVKPYKFEFGPFAPEVYKAPYHYEYRRPEGMSAEQYDQYILNEFKTFLQGDVAPENVAAVVMEPVQGEGGFVVPSKTFVQGVAEICKQHGIVFVADEIQTGFSRTGKLFAIEHFDVVPDLMTVSKSMGAGLPISGVIGRKEIMEAANPGELGGTYAGSPLGCRAALAVLDMIEKHDLNEKGRIIGEKVMDRFNRLADKYDIIGDVRGLGAMCAIEFVKDRQTKEPNKEIVGTIVNEANKRGLITLSAGLFGNVLRVLMPLVITDEQLEEGLDIIEEAMEAATSALQVH
ncbi:4-aminobutyrate--2-oxoglutarate transaminase [Aneurinibacillus aneurinilyticus]|jgi:4-aminobutyrate aminotransferase/(S)-3-amino-2-methylpropionate transaminase|uniref:(S)-3-amino-2-methylpropionate transaminase n=2 Tax=Aneurinibacillus aneurinilyticus TaxID=1391 RepID=A0A848CL56_ANEAE|nr:4-aminobutyrate--2-oxoglutarate transaminase [Aneurinibacillus aneurinilyticus]ERI06656.1 4-aminobutyrate transaminase [Aneurinibacillus aneurinilyticus ATCC 12856]MCI1694938.1 4-aminobutyrate--2-oxoglutarate transaminase [Aneurinibacillus aneurinilyticus]MED0670329.1 4-aminobutyrate--2-oxoglutarate transaminase [Aneurinibacillus aneurinilyticus]MED0707055.1 4-aminobutyrate--2-oxoglutarate transaminase [Aneurinibacillus aneurinilyticus]MED0723501.1 4-aminobutyrate--2-oxoglutarate transamina